VRERWIEFEGQITARKKLIEAIKSDSGHLKEPPSPKPCSAR